MKIQNMLTMSSVITGLVLIFSFQVLAEEVEIQGWDRLRWEMSPEEVRQAYFSYDNITGERMWKEETCTERFCVLKTTSFHLLGHLFPEITLSFFDKKLFKVEIREEISHRAIGLLAMQIEKLSALADRLIKKYGTPAHIGGSPTWQEDGKRISDILDQFLFFQRNERHEALSWLRPANGIGLDWQDEGGNELDFQSWYSARYDDQDGWLDMPQCHLEFRMVYVNTSLRDEYEQEIQKVRDAIEIGFESF